MAGKIIFPNGVNAVKFPGLNYSAGAWAGFIATPGPVSLAGVKPEANDLVSLWPKHPYPLRVTSLNVDIGTMIFADVGGAKGGNAGASTVADEALTWKLVMARLDKEADAENAVVAELSVAKAAGSAGSDNPAAVTLEDTDMAASVKNQVAAGISQDHPLIFTHFSIPVVLALKFSGAANGALEVNAGDDTKAKRMQSKAYFQATVRQEWSGQLNDGLD